MTLTFVTVVWWMGNTGIIWPMTSRTSSGVTGEQAPKTTPHRCPMTVTWTLEQVRIEKQLLFIIENTLKIQLYKKKTFLSLSISVGFFNKPSTCIYRYIWMYSVKNFEILYHFEECSYVNCYIYKCTFIYSMKFSFKSKKFFLLRPTGIWIPV